MKLENALAGKHRVSGVLLEKANRNTVEAQYRVACRNMRRIEDSYNGE